MYEVTITVVTVLESVVVAEGETVIEAGGVIAGLDSGPPVIEDEDAALGMTEELGVGFCDPITGVEVATDEEPGLLEITATADEAMPD